MKKVRNTRYRLQLKKTGEPDYTPNLALNIQQNLKDWLLIENPNLVIDIWNNAIGHRIANNMKKWSVYVHKTDIYFKNNDDYIEYLEVLTEKMESEFSEFNISKQLQKDRKFAADMNLYEFIDYLEKSFKLNIDFDEFDGVFDIKKDTTEYKKISEYSLKDLKDFCRKNNLHHKGKKSLLVKTIEEKFKPINIFNFFNDKE